MGVGDIKDEILIPAGSSQCLRDLEKRTSIYKVQSSVFVSLVKRCQAEPGSNCIVLDCRSRDQTQSGIHENIVQALKGLNVTSRLPPQAVCTSKDRENFKKWLSSNTHLREVFAFDCTGLGEATMLSRTLKYLGRTASKPKRLVILAAGLDSLAANPIGLRILTCPLPLHLVSTVKAYGVGSYVTTPEILSDTRLLEDLCVHLGISYIVNVTNRPATHLRSNTVHDLGSKLLPLTTEEKAAAFFTSIFMIIIKASAEKTSFLMVDTPMRGFAAIAIGSTLIEIANLSVVDALSLLRSRLNPPELDSYTKAALTLLSDRSVESPTRIQKAIGALAAKYRPIVEEDKNDGTTHRAPAKAPAADVFVALQPETMSDKWKAIQTYLEAHHHPTDVLQNIYKFITSVFNNVLVNPDEPKYKQLKMANPRVNAILGKSEVARMLMEAGGWILLSKTNCWVLDERRGYQGMRDVLVYISNNS